MDVLLYAPKSDETTSAVIETVGIAGLGREPEVYQEVQALADRLLQPKLWPTVAILVATDGYELQALHAIRSLLYPVKTIVVLPDRDANSITLGRSLHPRLLLFPDSDFGTLVGVLSKLDQKAGLRPAIETNTIP